MCGKISDGSSFRLLQRTQRANIRREMNPAPESPDGSRSGPLPRLLLSGPKVILLFAGYFLMHVVLRWITSDTTDLDESEQLLTTQQWQWGYGPQPPLYTWLLIPFIKAMGPSILALAIFKNALLFGLYSVTYASARMLLRDRSHQVLAAVSLLFLPQIAWEAQRDLSHSVLVAFFAALAFFLTLKLSHRREWPLYLALGLCFAGGILSKYSYLVFLGGLLIGLLCVRSTRTIVLNLRMVFTIAVTGLLLSPHLIWAREHMSWVTATSSKLHIVGDQAWGPTTLLGISDLLRSFLSHLGPILAVFLILNWSRRAPVTAAKPLPAGARVIAWSLVGIVALLLGGVFFFRVTGFKDRWLMPFCVWTPLLLVCFAASRMEIVRARRLATAAGIVAIAISILIPVRIWMARTFRFAQALNTPFVQLGEELRSVGVTNGVFIASDNWVGGNLKHCFPKTFVISPTV